MNKKAMDGGTVLVVLIVAAVVLLASGKLNLGAIGTPATPDSSTAGVTSQTPLVNFQAADLHNPATSLTPNVWFRVNDGLPQNDADGLSISIAVGQKVEYYVNESSYYGEHGSFVMPNTNVHNVPVKLLNWATAPTIQFINWDDAALNSLTVTLNLAANGNNPNTVKVFSNYQDGIMGATFVTDYVKTNIDDVTSSLGASVTAPDSLTHNTTAGRGTADTFKSFLIGDLNNDPSKTSQENREFSIAFDVGSTGYGSTNATIGLIDKDWYLDNSGGFSYGYEEPVTNTDVGQANHKFDAIIYTV